MTDSSGSALPRTMRYVACSGAGKPDVMHIQEGPVPQPGPTDVLIRVLAAGVNRPDISQRMGAYPPPPGASPVLGLEVSGVVVACGADAKRWKVGECVTALTNGGGYAQYCVAPQTQCLPWPTAYDAVLAAALPETYFTVWANLFQRGALRAGERALVHGGSSGIGVTALQLGAAFGATMYATAGSVEKCAACVGFGATEAFNYRTSDFAVELERATGGAGVDVILDMVGAPYLKRNIRSLARDGRLVSIAFLEGAVVEALDLTPIMTKRLTLTGSTMRPRTADEKAALAAELRECVWPLLDRGLCRPPVFATYPLEQVAAAHALLESSAHIGKVMLTLAD